MNARLLVGIILLSGISAALVPTGLSAQNETEYGRFRERTRYYSILFRGKAATSYSGTQFNGTYFWESPEFKPGTVRYNGKYYSDVFLNIDANCGDLLVRDPENRQAVILEKSMVEEFTIGEDRFVNLGAYYQVLGEGPVPVYFKVTKVLCNSIDNVNGRHIGYEDPDYNPRVFNYFAYDPSYYVLENGRLKKIGRRKALKIANGK